MNQKRFPERKSEQVQQATLCFLLKGDNILLSMKKRGFGKDNWNGTGGKFDPSKDKDIKETAIRETEEEIRVIPINLQKKALLHFYFTNDPDQSNWNQDVHVFVASLWQGEPQETEEMKPRWFRFAEIPFNFMWDDDRFWLLRVLAGEKLECWFKFDDKGENRVIYHKIKNLG